MSNAADTAKPDAAQTPPEATSASPVDSKPQAAAARPSRLQARLGALFALVLFLVLAAVIVSHWPALTGAQLQSRTNGAAQDDAASVQALRNETAALRARLQAAESQPAAPQVAGANANANISGDLATRIGGLESRLALLENQMTHVAGKDVQAQLQDQVKRLESESSNAALRRAASVLGLATLARATQSSSPFKTEFDALSAVAPGDPALPILMPYADMGVPTLEMLKARFPESARTALDAERAASGRDLFSRFWASLTNLVSIRRVGDVRGQTNSDKLARADAALARDDLAGAVAQVETVSGAAAAQMAGWLKDAQARLTVDRAVADMDSRIVQALAVPPQPPGTTPEAEVSQTPLSPPPARAGGNTSRRP